jgi:uncharacterized protein (DUF1800 family)
MAVFRLHVPIALLSVMTLGFVLTSILSPQPQAGAASPDPRISHILDRLGFGPRPGDSAAVQKMGIDAYLQQQLNPDAIPLPSTLTERLRQFPTLQKNAATLYEDHSRNRLMAEAGITRNKQKTPQTSLMAAMPPSEPAKPEIDPALRKMIRDRFQEPLREATEAKILRAVYSPRQLEEVMVNFWFNHFNVDGRKERTTIWVGNYENAIRPHVFGSFRTLLGVTAKHPAMLQYLDNWRNSAPNSTVKNKQFQGLNENYARELMELHTLGVNGGYSQTDVVEVAKVFTGWGFPPAPRWQEYPDGFFFNVRRHDASPKVVMKQSITAKGEAQGEQVLDFLANHPATAKHISYKLAQYFVADTPPQSLVDRLSTQFQQSRGNLRTVMTTLLKSPEFWDTKYRGNKFKTPFEYVISSLRTTELPEIPTQQISRHLTQMGMPLYQCKTPDGYPNTEQSWLSASALTQRLDFASAMSRGLGTNYKVDPNTLLQTFANPLSTKTQSAFQSAAPPVKTAVLLGSPEFMRR